MDPDPQPLVRAIFEDFRNLLLILHKFISIAHFIRIGTVPYKSRFNQKIRIYTSTGTSVRIKIPIPLDVFCNILDRNKTSVSDMFITRTVALHYGSCLKQNYGFWKLLVYWKFLSCHTFIILIISFCTIPSSSWSCWFAHLLCLIDICLFFLSYHELELVQGEEECQAGSAHLQAKVCGRGCRHKGRPG